MLQKRGIPHNVLNAKHHEREAESSRRPAAGARSPIATNMAGRGIDIVLGGNVELPRRPTARASAAWTRSRRPRNTRRAWHEELRHRQGGVRPTEADEVMEAGGLYILGTERHESRRIDNQLRGRSGRQGDPGESRFYLSLEDDLMRLFAGDRARDAHGPAGPARRRADRGQDAHQGDRERPEAGRGSRTSRSARTCSKYDEVMNQQRKVIYAERRRILEGENLQQQATDMLVDVITAYVNGATAEGYAEDWDLDALWSALKTLYPVGIDHESLTRPDEDSERDELTRDELLDALVKDAERAYAARETELEELAGEGAMRQLERNVLLNVIDRKWREHLYEMDYLKEGIGMRAMAQRDPLVEYQREGYDMFMAMLEGMKEESVGFLFNVTVEAVPAPQLAPVETPEGLADLAAGAGGGRTKRPPRCARKSQPRCVPRESITRRRP